MSNESSFLVLIVSTDELQWYLCTVKDETGTTSILERKSAALKEAKHIFAPRPVLQTQVLEVGRAGLYGLVAFLPDVYVPITTSIVTLGR